MLKHSGKMLRCLMNRSFATKMQASSTKNKKDAPGKRLGIKKSGGSFAFPNDILVRQR